MNDNFLRALYALAAMVLLGGSPTLRASTMLGDTLLIERLFPDLNTQLSPPNSTTVVTGTSDEISSVGGSELFNPEANSITIGWFRNSSYGGTATIFDGFRFTGFSHAITGVTAIDVVNISIADLAFGSNFINLNLGSAFDASSALTLQVEFAPVPVPPAIALFGSGLVCLLHRQKNKVGSASRYCAGLISNRPI